MASVQAHGLNLVLRWTVRRRSRGTIDVATVRAVGARLDRWMGRSASAQPGRAVTAHGVPCESFDLTVADPGRVLLYLHGGGFVVHLPAAYRAFSRRLSRTLGMRVVLPQYRLAPEHPFPAGSDDCLTTYRWLLDEGVDPRRIVIAGDSAGANLALVTVIRIRDAGLRPPACAAMFSGAFDLTWQSASLAYNRDKDPMIVPDALPVLSSYYIDSRNAANPWVSPIYADFASLPPLHFQAGGTEVLVDDSIRAADKARWAGVEVELTVWPGLPHVFQAVGWLPEAGQSLADVSAFVARHISAVTPRRGSQARHDVQMGPKEEPAS
jgi:acetyl esterase/lipase